VDKRNSTLASLHLSLEQLLAIEYFYEQAGIL